MCENRALKPRRSALNSALHLVLGLTVTLTACKSKDVVTHRVETPITVDGDMADWEAIPVSLMHKDHASLKLAADDEYLYGQFITDDPGWAMSILTTGITLYVNRDGSKEKEFFIRYRGGPSKEEVLARRRQRNPEQTGGPALMMPRMDPLEQIFPKDVPKLTCFVRDWIVEKEIPIDGAQGPAAAYGGSAGRFAYEFRIPLANSTMLYYGLSAGPGQKLGIGAIWGDLGALPNQPDEQEGTDEFGQPTSGSMPGDPFGAPAGGYAGPKGPGLPEKQEVWFKTHLPPAPTGGS